MLRACRSIRLTSQRSSSGLWAHIGSSRLSRSLTLLSTNGSIQYPTTVRTFCFSTSAESPLTIDQSNGIQLDRTLEILDGSFSPQAYIATIITSKSWFIGRLYLLHGSRRPCRFHPWQFARTRLDHAHTWWTCNVAEPHSILRRISRHVPPMPFMSVEMWLTFLYSSLRLLLVSFSY
jgi:hypothetical protein